MKMKPMITTDHSGKLWTTALWLSLITVGYNVVEGIVSTLFGRRDETLSLLGFGLDSFVEVISGIGVLHLVVRTRLHGGGRDRFERVALRITGSAFFLLSGGLVIFSIMNMVAGRRPETTMWGILIASFSLLTMFLLMTAKMSVGRRLQSEAIIADAHCTRTCIYLSAVLLLSSMLFELFRIGLLDVLGALGIAWYAFSEGREAFGKARGKQCGCRDDACRNCE